MKLLEFLQTIEAICEEHPDALDMDVVYATYYEACDYEVCVFKPKVCIYEPEERRVTLLKYPNEGQSPNAILIN